MISRFLPSLTNATRARKWGHGSEKNAKSREAVHGTPLRALWKLMPGQPPSAVKSSAAHGPFFRGWQTEAVPTPLIPVAPQDWFRMAD